jgi:hypothetical protein
VRLIVTPAYGWGWFKSDGSAFDVPPPFAFDAEIIVAGLPFQMAQGRVEGDNPFSGKWVVLLQRHSPADGECNLYVVPERPIVHSAPTPFVHEREVIGYASVSLELTIDPLVASSRSRCE